jgi:hypothetical protein
MLPICEGNRQNVVHDRGVVKGGVVLKFALCTYSTLAM